MNSMVHSSTFSSSDSLKQPELVAQLLAISFDEYRSPTTQAFNQVDSADILIHFLCQVFSTHDNIKYHFDIMDNSLKIIFPRPFTTKGTMVKCDLWPYLISYDLGVAWD